MSLCDHRSACERKNWYDISLQLWNRPSRAVWIDPIYSDSTIDLHIIESGMAGKSGTAMIRYVPSTESVRVTGSVYCYHLPNLEVILEVDSNA